MRAKRRSHRPELSALYFGMSGAQDINGARRERNGCAGQRACVCESASRAAAAALLSVDLLQLNSTSSAIKYIFFASHIHNRRLDGKCTCLTGSRLRGFPICARLWWPVCPDFQHDDSGDKQVPPSELQVPDMPNVTSHGSQHSVCQHCSLTVSSCTTSAAAGCIARSASVYPRPFVLCVDRLWANGRASSSRSASL